MRLIHKLSSHPLPMVVAGAFALVLAGSLLMLPKPADATTTYDVESYSNSSYNVVKNDFNQGETVFGKGTKTGSSASLRLEFKNPSNVSVEICGQRDGTWAQCPHALPGNAPIGTWTIELQKNDPQQVKDCPWFWCGSHWVDNWITKATDTFNVLTPAICGDGTVNQASEECDGTDGVGAHQTCSAGCKLVNLTYCGDTIVQTPNDDAIFEQCDDGNGVNTDTCSTSCRFTHPLVINEIDYDQPSAPDSAEFIEIKNVVGSTVNLDNFEVRLINGAAPAIPYKTIDLPDMNLASGDYYVICGDNTKVANCDLDVTGGTDLIQNGATDAVALYDTTRGVIVDTLSYEGSVPGYTETLGAGTDSSSVATQGLSRYTDGQDTDNNSSDFINSCITPGATNSNSPSCTATVSAQKVVCNSEADLPNWGDGGPEITSSTAANYVANSAGKCHLADWTFQWAPDGTANVNNNSGVADGAWSTPFGSSVQITAPVSKIWLREVWNADYIPFTGDTSAPWDDASAEFYCGTDVLNYDNYDWIENLQPGQTYYCVGFNVLAARCGDGTVNPGEACDDGDALNGQPNQCNSECTGTTTPICGNETVEAGEQCDYSSPEACTTADGYTGTKSCYMGAEVAFVKTEQNRCTWNNCISLESCGDGIKNGNEQCDYNDPNHEGVGANQTCSETCTVEDIPTFNITAYKWNDLNGDGYYSSCADLNSGLPMSCEQKLPGWTIFIDKNGDGILNDGETSTVTDEGGWYSFEGFLAGTYSVCEVQQAGWSQTFPASPVCHTVTLPNTSEGDTCAMINKFSGQVAPNQSVTDRLPECNFGNRKTPDISINKSVDMAVANEGDTLTYTITVKNTGLAGMYGLLVEDTLPTNTTLVADTFNPIPDNVTGDTYQWYTSIAPGETKTYSFKVTVNAGLPIGTTTITNTVTGKCSELNNTLKTVPYISCNIDKQTATAVTTVTKVEKSITPVVTFTLTKKVDKAIANPNDTLSYTLVVTNTGNAEAANVTLTDTLPAGLTYLDANGVNTGETTKTWTWATLAAGASQTVTYKTHVDSNATAKQYVNSATVKADGVPGVTAQATSEVRTPTVLGDETATLAITKTAKEKTVNPGGTITFTVTVTNNGNTPALNTVLTDTLPQGMVFADNKTTTQNWDLGDLVPTESATRTYTVNVDSGTLPGKYVNTAVAKADSTASVSAQANVEVIAGKVLGEETDIVPTVTTLPSTNGLGLLPSLIAGLSILGGGLILAKKIK